MQCPSFINNVKFFVREASLHICIPSYTTIMTYIHRSCAFAVSAVESVVVWCAHNNYSSDM